jgi:hypothetical protein
MKYSFLVLSLFLCASHFTFSMEPTPKTDEQLLTDFHDAIEEKYGQPLFAWVGPAFFEVDPLHIVTAATYPQPLSKDFITKLCNKNSYFKYTLEHFIDLARRNLRGVTIDTLEAIFDASLPQKPEWRINKLPRELKKYVMDEAYNTLRNQYTLKLSGHTDTILDADICETQHLLVTCSRDKTFRLWDLQSAKSIYIFHENDCIHRVKFNHDGSQLITVTNYNDNSNIIKIWNTTPPTCAHSFKHTGTIDTLQFSSPYNILETYTLDPQPQLTIFSTDNPPSIITHIEELPYTVKKTETHRNNNQRYSVYEFNYDCYESGDPTIQVIKKDCRPFYITLQAIKNTPDYPEKNLRTSKLLEKFPQCENEKILHEFEKKFPSDKLITHT